MLLRGQLWATGCVTLCCAMPASKHQIRSYRLLVATCQHCTTHHSHQRVIQAFAQQRHNEYKGHSDPVCTVHR